MKKTKPITNNIFITGATGFLGANLTKRILKDSRNRVFVLLRTNLSEKIIKRDHRKYVRMVISKPLKREIDRIHFIKGDVTKENLGISKRNLKFLKNNISTIYHSAALRDFNCSLETIRKINVKGTENLIKLGMNWKKTGKLQTINHISTTYISGDYKKTFFENQLNVSQKFKNTYEQSKYEAEKVVNDYRKKNLWIDIYRPSVLTDSVEIPSEKESMLYRILDLYISGIFSEVPSKYEACINLIPVDTASNIIYQISNCEGRKVNQTYHVANKYSSNFHTILKVIKKTYKLKKLKTTNSWNKNSVKKSIFEQRFEQFLYPYMMQKTSYDLKNTEPYIKRFNIKVPRPTMNVIEKLLNLYTKRGLVKLDK